MKYFISDLIVGMKHFAEFADWIESSKDPDFGIEFTAFTHDEAYWQSLAAKVPQMTCPLTFHGPYVNIEATSDIGSEENVWLMESYKKVFALAMQNQVRYVVFHYSQLQFKTEEGMQTIAYWMMGSLAGAKWGELAIIAPIIMASVIFFWTQSRVLNLMLLGDESAITMETDLHAYRQWYLLISSLIVGFAVYSAGMIGFVGLIILHVIRMFTGPDHKRRGSSHLFLGFH